MEKILAKDSGETLEVHSKKVRDYASEIVKQSIKYTDHSIIKDIEIAALLHDIGKVTSHFQEILTKGKSKTKFKFRHNELGWAFLYMYLDLSGESLENVLDAVYWHHGISNKMGKDYYDDIISYATDEDITNMKNFVIDMLGENSILDTPRIVDRKTPIYYNPDPAETCKNKTRTFIRTCVISADRMVSKLGDKYDLFTPNEYVSNVIRKTNGIPKFDIPYVGERIEVQKQLVLDADNHTTIVKAPAGFGKTLVGLLWNLKSDKKLIWVCPRNIVAESVYESIKAELTTLGVDLSVELYLTGKIKPGKGEGDGFESDIIVTNIDNFLNPSVDNLNSDRLFFINNCDVVFDEYHELVNELALFAGFTNIMLVRNRLTLSRTLLLSATPIRMEFLWDSLSNKTVVLPKNGNHYSAVHKEKYKLNVSTLYPSPVKGNNNLVFFNAIFNAQEFKFKSKFDKLFHSDFEIEKRDNDFTDLYLEYNKESKKVLGKSDVVTTPVLQASLDVSFLNLYESVISPEATIQRIGRCNRWGGFYVDQTPTINIFLYKNKSENYLRSKLYNKSLSEKWYNLISKYNGEHIILDELYTIYNKFNTDNEDEIKRYVNKEHRASLEFFGKIYPKKYSGEKDDDVLTAGSNVLRTNNYRELFVVAKNYGNNSYTKPFNTTIYKDFDDDFGEDKHTLGKMNKLVKQFTNAGLFAYPISKYQNKDGFTLDQLRDLAKKNNTPYIRFDKIYHPVYGLIKEEKLNKFVD